MEQEHKNRIILIGPTMSGKTTLAQKITDRDLLKHKTQSLKLIDNFIFDTPGEYLEMVSYRGALSVTSADADIIVFVQSAIDESTALPPSYAALFCKPVFGVVTKADVASESQIKKAIEQLKMAGAQKTFVVSSVTGKGIDYFKKAIEKKQEGAIKKCLVK